jgi:NADP-reducing hydrogenase subunit HndD
MQQADNIAVIGRGTEVSIRNLEAECDGNCIGCGRCIRNCPTGALTERDDTEQVWKNLHGKKKHVAVILSETSLPEFSTFCQTKSGTVSVQTAAAALKKCGVDVVLDAAAGVAFTVNGQLEELKARREKKDTKPLIAAECPAAYRYVQTRFPELKDCLSQVKDPVEQLAQWYRTNYKGEKELFLVSVEPCTARKASCANGESGVDVSLTGREAARMFQRACVSRFTMNQVLDRMNGEMLDFPYGLTSCSCEEYNSKGSLMNALIAKEKLYRAVTVYGLEKGKELLEMVQKKESDMDYLDLLACPKGCR